MKVKIADIYIGERFREEMGDIKEMAQDLLDNGQITAVTLRPANEVDQAEEDYKGQPYSLVAGGRRIAGAMFIGWKEINAFIREDDISALKHRVLELHENIKRKDMTIDEQLKLKREILRLRQLEDPTITQAEVAVEIGDSPGWFSRSIEAADAVEKNPNLSKAGSVKAILRVSKLEGEMKARIARSKDDSDTVAAMNLQGRMVTADMRNWLRKRPDLSANLTVVDYPYGMNYWKSGHKEKTKARKNKAQPGLSHYNDTKEYAYDLVVDTLPEIVRTTRESGWMIFFANYDFEKFLRETIKDVCSTHYDYREPEYEDEDGNIRTCNTCQSAPKKFKKGEPRCKFLIPEPMPWIWYRPNSQNNPRHPDIHAKNLHEYMVVVNRGAARLNMPPSQKNVPNVLVYDAYYGSDRFHANQKPIELYQDLIERTTDLGDIVVDPAFGSGASMAAAGSKARYFYGCELNEDMRGPAIGLVAKHLVPMSGISEESSAKRAELLALKPVDEEVLADTEEIEDTQSIQLKEFFNKRDQLLAEDKVARKVHKDAKQDAARRAAIEKAQDDEFFSIDEDEDSSFEMVEEL